MQRAVAKGGVEDLLLLAGKPAPCIGVGKELRQIFVEVEIVADDGADRRLHRLVAIAFGKMRRPGAAPLPRRLHVKERGAAIGAGRPELGEVDDVMQQGVGDVPLVPGIMRARGEKQLIETGLSDLVRQTGRTSCTSGMKCLSRVLDAVAQVAVELGQPEQAPRMCR